MGVKNSIDYPNLARYVRLRSEEDSNNGFQSILFIIVLCYIPCLFHHVTAITQNVYMALASSTGKAGKSPYNIYIVGAT